MRHLLVLLLSTVWLQAGAQAPDPAAGLPPCDKAVRFSAAWFADPEVDNRKSSAELTKLGSAVEGRAMQLGHVIVENRLTVAAQTTCRGLVVRLEYVQPVLRVASEIPPGGCAYARVMNHEQTHVRIHRDIASRFRELDYPWSADAGSAAILTYAKQELDRLMRAQQLFDSPEEYARNESVCGGEIARLVKPAASSRQPVRKPG